MKLYELTKDYAELTNMVESGEFTADEIADTLDGIQGEIDDKLQCTVCVIKDMEGEAKKFDDEIARMQDVKRSYVNTAKRLKDYIRFEMEKVNLDKSKGLFSISLGKPNIQTQIDDVDQLPDEYKTISVTVDKKALGKALKEGRLIAGASLIEVAKRLTIR